jgi:hypothetical protein
MMDHSMVLLNAQVQFLESRLAIVHIPLHLYPHFIQPILRLLTLSDNASEVNGLPRRKWAYPNTFTNISVTTIECSIVCPRALVEELFLPLIESLDAKAKQAVIISKDDFVVIQVGGEGMEAGQRVLDLTAPIALAGISIFFITSYYSDFVLVPYNSKGTVISALEERGFAFEPMSNGHGANMTNVSSPLHSHNRNSSSSSSLDYLSHQPPGTPPPATVAEWQTKTFSTLHRNDILPLVNRSLELRICAGYRNDSSGTNDAITLGIFKCLLANPRFMSITLTQSDTVSLTLDQALLGHFPDSGDGILLQTDQTYFAIVFDLRKLPEASTGIICGVAGRLLDRLGEQSEKGTFNMSYLSTARAGNVIVREDEVDEALEALLEEEAMSVDGP